MLPVGRSQDDHHHAYLLGSQYDRFQVWYTSPNPSLELPYVPTLSFHLSNNRVPGCWTNYLVSFEKISLLQDYYL